MTTRRLALLLIAPLVLAALAGCSPTAPTEPEPPKFTSSLVEVRDASMGVVDKLIAEFPESAVIAEPEPNVTDCAGEDAGVGRWIMATTFSSTDVASTVAEVQQEYGDAVTSTGTANTPAEYADGTTWPVTGSHTLIEDETGSYLLMYPTGAEGSVLLRVVTACGVLR
ncbi:hypothetical protein EYE40_13050 [Glaciihabitans arcticus]|uniref:Uncharacterized protein n=1 Tax=Glaciihabitans arcticus TaxID=2668039 RepID=A0A4Q9GT79_9MICO|nr:hypothetical protein [Glaciihabitans arcticus]TBN58246.1 hypothetical protein EYE40_13050 [Glaciihabitans arcticus]